MHFPVNYPKQDILCSFEADSLEECFEKIREAFAHPLEDDDPLYINHKKYRYHADIETFVLESVWL